MPSKFPRGVAWWAAVTSAAVMAVIAAAFGITIWRYEAALSSGAAAAGSLSTAQTADRLMIEFQQEQAAAHRYLVRPSAVALRQTVEERADFADRLAVLRRTPSQADNLTIAQAGVGEQNYYAVFTGLRGLAGRSTAAVAQAGDRLDTAGARVLGPLSRAEQIEAAAAASAQGASNSAQDQARVIGILGGVLALLAGTGFAIFMVLLLRRSAAREVELRTTLGRLSDRDTLAQIEQALQAGGLTEAGQAAGAAGWPGPGGGRPAAGNGHVLTTVAAPAASAAGLADPGGAR